MPCTEKRARLLLERGRARIHKVVPFTIRVVDRQVEGCELQPLRIKIDPGSKTTGIALVRETSATDIVVLNLFELSHRGKQISEALTSRRGHRRQRRSHLRYRAPRFLNRGNKKKGWLAPSLQHQVESTMAWVNRIRRYAPVSTISCELVRFDTQALENPEVEGAQYQQGTLAGYEVREYLLEKWNRACAYCGAQGVPLQIEHIQPKARGGSNRISNLTLACGGCNSKKAALPVEVCAAQAVCPGSARDTTKFLAKKPERLKRILAQVRRPLKDAAAVNATRWALVKRLKATGLVVETASGGKTKFNRNRLGIPKTHALDAVCVSAAQAVCHEVVPRRGFTPGICQGALPKDTTKGEVSSATGWRKPTLCIKATGRGSYQRTSLDKYGCVRGHLTRSKSIKGFQTGDLVRAEVTQGKKKGSYIGRVAVRAYGSFNIQTKQELIQGVSYRFCKVVQRGDGYAYCMAAKSDVQGVANAKV